MASQGFGTDPPVEPKSSPSSTPAVVPASVVDTPVVKDGGVTTDPIDVRDSVNRVNAHNMGMIIHQLLHHFRDLLFLAFLILRMMQQTITIMVPMTPSVSSFRNRCVLDCAASLDVTTVALLGNKTVWACSAWGDIFSAALDDMLDLL
uniref:Uncharacterized protein n=1 Tax=Tanacetum cinerariifolium TaxID=118510 RepID=A0A6L2KE40_TANCI|nr:hypothetical protein [Tanacetum cinerariifolium]